MTASAHEWAKAPTANQIEPPQNGATDGPIKPARATQGVQGSLVEPASVSQACQAAKLSKPGGVKMSNAAEPR